MNDIDDEDVAVVREEARESVKLGEEDEDVEENDVDDIVYVDDEGFVQKGQEPEEEENRESKLYTSLMRQKCCAACLSRFPRTCAILVGVIIPLFILITISLVFGSIFCQFEAPPEIEANNHVLENTYWAIKSSERLVNLTQVIPRMCFALYLSQTHNNTNITAPTAPYSSQGIDPNISSQIAPLLRSAIRFSQNPLDTILIPDLGEDYPRLQEVDFDPEVIIVNSTDFFLFMSECGESTSGAAKDLLSQAIDNFLDASSPLTFNWIRCFEGADGGTANFGGGSLTAEQRSKAGQTDIYTKTWEQDRKEIFAERFQMYLDQGLGVQKAFELAATEAAAEASGGSVCEFNAPAAAWFWFTVQTTIGYGNTPPTTTASRALVYTVGFFSILAFGGILAMTGYIFSFLFDDYAKRIGWNFLTTPWMGCLIWGIVYYTWMIFIAWATIEWKHSRLDLPFSARNAYWFSFISTTTVGLGDLVLEPEGIIGGDLLIFPLLFLIGLIYFSSFVGKFAELIISLLKGERESFVQTLLGKKVGFKETFRKQNPS